MFISLQNQKPLNFRPPFTISLTATDNHRTVPATRRYGITVSSLIAASFRQPVADVRESSASTTPRKMSGHIVYAKCQKPNEAQHAEQLSVNLNILAGQNR